MHSKRYSQEEVRFRSQMLYTVFSLSGHSSQADPSFKRTIFLRPVIPYAIINLKNSLKWTLLRPDTDSDSSIETLLYEQHAS
jgi:hypothetical protein